MQGLIGSDPCYFSNFTTPLFTYYSPLHSLEHPCCSCLKAFAFGVSTVGNSSPHIFIWFPPSPPLGVYLNVIFLCQLLWPTGLKSQPPISCKRQKEPSLFCCFIFPEIFIYLAYLYILLFKNYVYLYIFLVECKFHKGRAASFFLFYTLLTP